ncbi:helix-turn-helix domain-containing protein [Nonomuraea sp. NBC_01738]|uniref:helix-turn-helix domain-containing protein n=1 Tax=Nonomuraea sp. NBC_01738 TaxID=2976003 RepID=UPI002E11CE7A|nr:helix-turn-helix domain-containing protein [Nonomuraea sp. NBC_01738]
MKAAGLEDARLYDITQAMNRAPDTQALFLTPAELAALLKVPLETVYQWRRKRTGPPGFRAGKHLRYDLHAFRAWVSQQTEARAS